MTVTAQARATIGRQMAHLFSEYYGQGPTKVKTHADGDVVVVLLEESFTPAERTLIERGEAQSIQDIRRRFQRAMAAEFTATVEGATGRTVRSFMSETDLENDISVEIFILEPEPESP